MELKLIFLNSERRDRLKRLIYNLKKFNYNYEIITQNYTINTISDRRRLGIYLNFVKTQNYNDITLIINPDCSMFIDNSEVLLDKFMNMKKDIVVAGKTSCSFLTKERELKLRKLISKTNTSSCVPCQDFIIGYNKNLIKLLSSLLRFNNIDSIDEKLLTLKTTDFNSFHVDTYNNITGCMTNNRLGLDDINYYDTKSKDEYQWEICNKKVINIITNTSPSTLIFPNNYEVYRLYYDKLIRDGKSQSISWTAHLTLHNLLKFSN